MGMKSLWELFHQIDFLGFRLKDWHREQSLNEYYAKFQEAERRRIEEETALIEAEW